MQRVAFEWCYFRLINLIQLLRQPSPHAVSLRKNILHFTAFLSEKILRRKIRRCSIIITTNKPQITGIEITFISAEKKILSYFRQTFYYGQRKFSREAEGQRDNLFFSVVVIFRFLVFISFFFSFLIFYFFVLFSSFPPILFLRLLSLLKNIYFLIYLSVSAPQD